MEVSGQLHIPASLPPGKESPVRIEQESGCAPRAVLDEVEEKNTPAPTGKRTPVVQSVTYSLYRMTFPAPDLHVIRIQTEFTWCSFD
jgi:hypothetical protein